MAAPLFYEWSQPDIRLRYHSKGGLTKHRDNAIICLIYYEKATLQKRRRIHESLSGHGNCKEQ